MKLFFITNSPAMARFAQGSGADRIFVDLEILGKQARQGHLDTLISSHSLADVAAMRPHVAPGTLLVRINPPHDGSFAEIEAVLAAGADILMLPMFHTPAEVEIIAASVAGRARLCLLVETVGAMQTLAECVAVPGVDEVHIGLNDLHLALGRRFMFELLADGTVERMATILRRAGIDFGIGGVARVGEGQLPAELILAEHARLGSTAAILSRTFHRRAQTVEQICAEMDFGAEIGKLRAAYADHGSATPAALAAAHARVQVIVEQIAASMAAAASTAS